MNNFSNILSKVQNIEIAEYVLKPKYILNSKLKSSNHKKGFLLKINFKETGEGFSDCFSWQELGDLSLKDQILNLKNKVYNNHLKKSISFSYIDSLYRSKKQNIFSDLLIPKNHFTCTDVHLLSSHFIEQLNEQGFLKIKIKCGLNLRKEAHIIKNLYIFNTYISAVFKFHIHPFFRNQIHGTIKYHIFINTYYMFIAI